MSGREPEKAKEPQVAFVAPTNPSPEPQKPAVSDGACDGLLVSVAMSREKPCIKPGSGKSFEDCPKCPEMVIAPSGIFMMGSPKDEPERSDHEGPQHEVKIAKPFAVGKFSVTFAEWNACVAGGGCAGYRPSAWRGLDGLPLIDVSWNDAKAYVAWLSKKTGMSYRLPSEAEHEYVTRAGTATPFWWGASRPPDPLTDVWDWVEDCWHDNYDGAPTDGSSWTTGECLSRVIRGGSWLRAAYRDNGLPDSRADSVGFRVARTLH